MPTVRRNNERLRLPNSCSATHPSVYPGNWEDEDAPLTDWYIQYRFYDPSILPGQKFHKGKLCVIKGMNDIKALGKRQQVTRERLNQIIVRLQQGYNPITQKTKEDGDEPIGPSMPIITALTKALALVKVERDTRKDIRSVLKFFSKAARKLGYDQMPSEQVRRRHIRAIFDKLAEIKKAKWTNNNYNFYRANLMILFAELVEYEAVTGNFPKELRKRKVTRKRRKVLTEEQRVELNTYLHSNNYRYWLVVNMFYSSGSRRTEFVRLRLKDVDLAAQLCTYTVMKGQEPTEVIRPISNDALPYWKAYIDGCTKQKYYLIGKGLRPARKHIRPEQLSRRWRTWVKKPLGYDEDSFYGLKHLHSDEVAKKLSLKHAAVQNSHTNISTTRIYAVNEDSREIKRLKKVKTSLASKGPKLS